MKLILTHEVTGLGSAGDVVEVKDGYGRNYLIPRGLGTQWTRGAQTQIDALRKAREARAIASLDDAKGVKGQLEAKTLKIAAQATDSGRLFGAISQAEVADAAQAAGISIDRRTIEFPSAIKATGVHTATVRLHPEVSATVKVEVVKA